MCGRLVLGGEQASAFHGDVDTEILPRQLGRITFGGDLDRAIAEADGIALDGNRAGEAAVHAVIAQQVGVGFNRAEVVDGDNLDVLAVRLSDGAQDIAADAAKPVDGYTNCHFSRSRLVQLPRPRGATTLYSLPLHLPKFAERRVCDRFSGNPELFIEFLVRCTGAE
jgi:hypothetical protein